MSHSKGFSNLIVIANVLIN